MAADYKRIGQLILIIMTIMQPPSIRLLLFEYLSSQLYIMSLCYIMLHFCSLIETPEDFLHNKTAQSPEMKTNRVSKH